MNVLDLLRRLRVLLDPAVLLALLLCSGAAGFAGYLHGSSYASLECTAEQSETKDAVIEGARSDARGDEGRAATAERTREKARVASQEARLKLNKELVSHEPPVDCRITDLAFRLLVQSACDANGASDCPGGMYDGVRGGAETGRPRPE